MSLNEQLSNNENLYLKSISEQMKEHQKSHYLLDKHLTNLEKLGTELLPKLDEINAQLQYISSKSSTY